MATLITAHDNFFLYILYKYNYSFVIFFSYWVSVMYLSVLYVTVQNNKIQFKRWGGGGGVKSASFSF